MKKLAQVQPSPSLNSNVRRYSRTTHGLSGSVEWQAWVRMRNRCNDPKNAKYKYYGGRGIKVCSRWNKSFMNFYEDMGKRPAWASSLDRKDSDGNYEPGNCRWANRIMQARNRRNTILIDGMSLKQWCKKNGRSYQYTHKVFREVNSK